jgi:hypothetical protein
MIWTRDDYKQAAIDRIGEAYAIRRVGRHVLAMFIAGLAAECMLRAWHHLDRRFDERHDLVRLFGACDLECLGDSAVRRLRPSVQIIHLLWRNSYRYAREMQVRNLLRELRLDRDVHRNADKLKVKCGHLLDACSEVVTVGADLWHKKP